MGSSLIVLGALVAFVGLEQAMTTINDQMAVLPLGLSRILGITVHLDIPLDLPRYIALLGAILAILGLLLSRLRKPGPAGVL
jgi:hypothetical protein